MQLSHSNVWWVNMQKKHKLLEPISASWNEYFADLEKVKNGTWDKVSTENKMFKKKKAEGECSETS